MKTKSKPLSDPKHTAIQGLNLVVGHPMTSGPTLRVTGQSEASQVLSDRAILSRYSQIEFVAPNGGPSTFVVTNGLLNHPQIFVAYHDSGFPLLLGVKALEGRSTTLGPTRIGRSTTTWVMPSTTSKYEDKI